MRAVCSERMAWPPDEWSPGENRRVVGSQQTARCCKEQFNGMAIVSVKQEVNESTCAETGVVWWAWGLNEACSAGGSTAQHGRCSTDHDVACPRGWVAVGEVTELDPDRDRLKSPNSAKLSCTLSLPFLSSSSQPHVATL